MRVNSWVRAVIGVVTQRTVPVSLLSTTFTSICPGYTSATKQSVILPKLQHATCGCILSYALFPLS